MPRADKATFIQGMLSEHQLRQQREATKPAPDSKEWWRDVAQGLGVELAALRATVAEQAATIARLEGERDALEQILAGERNMLVSAWLDRGERLPGAEKQSTIQRVLRGIHDFREAEYAALERAMQAEAERDALTARVAELEARDIPDATLDELVGWSFRYGLGRQSYAVGMIAEAVRTYRQRLLPQTRARLMREIEEAIQRGGAGMACDVREWEAVHTALKEHP